MYCTYKFTEYSLRLRRNMEYVACRELKNCSNILLHLEYALHSLSLRRNMEYVAGRWIMFSYVHISLPVVPLLTQLSSDRFCFLLFLFLAWPEHSRRKGLVVLAKWCYSWNGSWDGVVLRHGLIWKWGCLPKWDCPPKWVFKKGCSRP